MSKASTQAYKQEAIDYLLTILKPGDTVFTTVKQVARSGMSRHITLHIIDGTDIRDITRLVGRAIGERQSDKTGGLVIGGCGMDMGLHVVYTLGYALWPDGTPEPHGTRNGAPDSAGGYALKQRWL